ncbi:hypothetical protein P3T36_001139 [Kitasatospora sp. MAP12-15]|uniref:hypothetical protein n=1 Tax=unclassified Kitasatospora TaxID=2633591 RepID=UPI0024734108|nr:hypothetical protein [Kitasatospora sp. MAP12-44]MDH6114788.1 hypothetical protein [Kitasatospora sp. MAP12-44]
MTHRNAGQLPRLRAAGAALAMTAALVGTLGVAGASATPVRHASTAKTPPTRQDSWNTTGACKAPCGRIPHP